MTEDSDGHRGANGNGSSLPTIEGVEAMDLREIPDARGSVLHMVKEDQPGFRGFGELYFSEVHSGMVKAWRLHREFHQQLTVPVGRVRVVLFDHRPGSPTEGALDILEIGRPDAYRLLRIPPGVWYGFQGMGPGISLIANCSNRPYDPSEISRLPDTATEVPFDWNS